MDTISFDPGNNWVIGSGYKVPQAGYYAINGHVQLQAVIKTNSIDCNVVILKNGAIVSIGSDQPNGGAGTPAYMVSDIVQCAVGDFIQIGSTSNTAQALNTGTSAANYLSIVRVA